MTNIQVLSLESIYASPLTFDEQEYEKHMRSSRQVISNPDKLSDMMMTDPSLVDLVGFDELKGYPVLLKDLPKQGANSPSALSKGESFPIPLEEAHMRVIYSYLKRFFSHKEGKPSYKEVEAHLLLRANSYRVNPIKDYFNSLEWDGEERLKDFMAKFWRMPDDQEYLGILGTRFIVATVARGYVESMPYTLQWMPVLTGGQGVGKSRFVRILGGKWTKEDLSANLKDKDAAIQLQGKLIVEFSELASLRRNSHEEAKSFISRDVDCFRKPYATCARDYPRRNSFVGTSNEEQFLSDITGNRRYAPIFVPPKTKEQVAEDEEYLKSIKDELWAEAVHIYKNNPDFVTHIDGDFEELLKPQLERAFRGDILTEKVQAALAGTLHGRSSYNSPFKKPFALYILATHLDEPCTPKLERRLAGILRKLGYNNNCRVNGKRLWTRLEENQ